MWICMGSPLFELGHCICLLQAQSFPRCPDDSEDPPMWDNNYSTEDLSRFVSALPAQQVGQISVSVNSMHGAAW